MNDSRIRVLLVVLASVFTLIPISYVFAGFWAFMAVTVVGLAGTIGWLIFSFRSPPDSGGLIGRYILMIVALLALATARYVSGYATLIGADANWWIAGAVILPLSILLCGGYFLSRGSPAGIFFAWTGSIYAIVEAVTQFWLELGHWGDYRHVWYLGVPLAMLVFFLACQGVLKLIRPELTVPKMTAEVLLLTARQRNLWSLLFLSAMLLYAVTVYVEGGLLPVGIIVGSMMGGLIAWRMTTSRKPADRYVVVPLFLLMLSLFYFHVGEEILTHFNIAIGQLSGKPWGDFDFNIVIVFGGPLLWFFAAYSLWRGHALGNFILWFMIVGMILGEPAHLLVFPLVKMLQSGGTYDYFPGMATALFPMIPAILALLVILKNHRVAKPA